MWPHAITVLQQWPLLRPSHSFDDNYGTYISKEVPDHRQGRRVLVGSTHFISTHFISTHFISSELHFIASLRFSGRYGYIEFRCEYSHTGYNRISERFLRACADEHTHHYRLKHADGPVRDVHNHPERRCGYLCRVRSWIF
jgi:hypothetical protein